MRIVSFPCSQRTGRQARRGQIEGESFLGTARGSRRRSGPTVAPRVRLTHSAKPPARLSFSAWAPPTHPFSHHEKHKCWLLQRPSGRTSQPCFQSTCKGPEYMHEKANPFLCGKLGFQAQDLSLVRRGRLWVQRTPPSLCLKAEGCHQRG